MSRALQSRSYQEASGNSTLKELTALVTEVRPAGPGRILVTLDNGQIWSQVSAPSLKIKANDKVTIRKAAFGSYKMKKDGSNRMMRVHREL